MKSNHSLIRACGVIGLTGALLPIPADIISWFLAENYSPIENSISKLAVGDSSWMIDLGLWLFAIACLATALGLCASRVRAKWWTLANVSLLLVGACVAVIVHLNQYAGTQNPGANIHLWAVCGVGLFFLATTWLAVPGLRLISNRLAWFSLALGMVWVVLTPIYWFAVPDGWSGAFERLLALMMISWVAVMAQRLRRSGERST